MQENFFQVFAAVARDQVGRRSAIDDGACTHDGDIGGHALDLRHIVRGEQYGRAGSRLVIDQIAADPIGGVGIERSGRLVEQQNLRPVEQGLGQGDARALAGGEIAERPLEKGARLQFLADLGDAGIDVRQIDAAGNKVGPETLINDLVNGQQLGSAVTLLANGDISVTWTDVPNDGSGYGVFSKIIDLTPNLFTAGDDIIDFNLVSAGTYEPGSQYMSGDGADMIWLPADAVAATAAGYDLNHAFDAGNGNDMITGSDLADTIFGGAGEDTLIGGMGNDILDLGAADGDADTVVATLDGGEDMVFNFEVAHDQIDVSAFGFADFRELEPSISMNGSDAVVSLPGGVTISLSLINDEDLTSGNFIF